jgi:hypothetical protein
MQKIELTQGKFALVDDEDYAELIKYKWFARRGKLKKSFYAFRNKKVGPNQYKTILMHREILQITDSNTIIDHKDFNGLNNQKNNLRIATSSQNMAHRTPKAGSTSKYLGVYWSAHCNKWRAQMSKNRKRKHLGLFETEEQAALAYNKAAMQLHGEFANLNTI